MGFKNPKSHGDIVKTMNIFSIISKVTKLAKHLERKFMLSSHTKPLEDLISSVSRYIYISITTNSKLRESAT